MVVDIYKESVEDDQLNDLAQSLYKSATRNVRPLFPWVLVRVLRRDMQYKGLVLPAHEQQKVVHEGIVLSTWREFTEETGKKMVDNQGTFTKVKIRRSAFSIGDHVLFPHWAGFPAVGLNPNHYRLVKECDWQFDREGGILAVVDYEPEEYSVLSRLEEIVGNDAEGVALSRKIQDEFLLVDKNRKSVTLSSL